MHLHQSAGDHDLDVEIYKAELGGSRLARAYLEADETALSFYGRARPDQEGTASLVASLDQRWTEAARREVVTLFRGQASKDADRLERFVSERGFVVTTGQQAGFLTGPMYTISKALGAVAHAARLEEATGRPVLPVFWIASEDHDWEEAESALFLDAGGSPLRLSAQAATQPGNRSVYEVPTTGINQAVASLRAIWPEGALVDQALAAIEAAYPDGATLAQGFETLLDELLGGLGLLIVQAHDPELKRQSSAVLSAALKEAHARSSALDKRGSELEAAGYHQQVTWAAGATNVFLAGDQGRERVHATAKGFRLGGEGPTLSLEGLLGLMAEDPSRATPDALLRPVVEAAVLPVLAYVAGPGEIAYYAQNGPLYDASEVVRPDLLGRPALRVVEPKVQKALARIGLDSADVGGPLHELQSRLARSLMPDSVQDIIRRTRKVFDEGLEALGETVANIDPTMSGPVLQAGRRGQQSLERAEKKIMQAVKRRSTEALAHLDRARAGLYPEGVPQERSVNVFYFLGRYGMDFIAELNAAVVAQIRE